MGTTATRQEHNHLCSTNFPHGYLTIASLHSATTSPVTVPSPDHLNQPAKSLSWTTIFTSSPLLPSPSTSSHTQAQCSLILTPPSLPLPLIPPLAMARCRIRLNSRRLWPAPRALSFYHGTRRPGHSRENTVAQRV